MKQTLISTYAIIINDDDLPINDIMSLTEYVLNSKTYLKIELFNTETLTYDIDEYSLMIENLSSNYYIQKLQIFSPLSDFYIEFDILPSINKILINLVNIDYDTTKPYDEQ